MRGFIRFSAGLTMASCWAVGCAPQETSISTAKVIYGTDQRKDLDDPANTPAMVDAARSTAVLVHRSDLSSGADGSTQSLPAATLKEVAGVCDSEPFAAQPSAGFCSGFLVAPDVLVTAGHCVLSQSDCDGIALVFDYAYATPASVPTTARTANVYFCKDVVARKQDDAGADFAVIHLDRPVADRAALAVRTTGRLGDAAALTMIGYPAGIPAKIDGGKHVKDNSAAAFFQANTDSFGGSSGSAVLGSASGQVEGVLVRGEQDFVDHHGCLISKVCPESGDGCRGEDATRATEFAALLPAPAG